MSEWGKLLLAGGLAVLGYQWGYVPFCIGWGFEPWTATNYGLLLFGSGLAFIFIAAFRAAHT